MSLAAAAGNTCLELGGKYVYCDVKDSAMQLPLTAVTARMLTTVNLAQAKRFIVVEAIAES